MNSSQHATLSTPTEPVVQKRFNIKRLFTPTTIVVSIATALNTLGVVMILGSMQQIYKQLNTLTEFTGSCIMNNHTENNMVPQSELKPSVIPTTPKPTLVVRQPLQAVPDKKITPPNTSPTPHNRLFDIGDIIDKK